MVLNLIVVVIKLISIKLEKLPCKLGPLPIELEPFLVVKFPYDCVLVDPQKSVKVGGLSGLHPEEKLLNYIGPVVYRFQLLEVSILAPKEFERQSSPSAEDLK